MFPYKIVINYKKKTSHKEQDVHPADACWVDVVTKKVIQKTFMHINAELTEEDKKEILNSVLENYSYISKEDITKTKITPIKFFFIKEK